MKTTDSAPGFYDSSLEESDTNPVNLKKQDKAGEFSESEGTEDVYEEVPWLTQKPVFFPGLSNAKGDYTTVTENLYDEDNTDFDAAESEIDIEEEQMKYWKCPKCKELVEMHYDVCWKCQSEMPDEAVHPDAGEVIKEISENRYTLKTAGFGMALIILGLIEMLFDKRRYSLFDHNERFVFGSVFILLGIGLILFKFRKNNFPNQ